MSEMIERVAIAIRVARMGPEREWHTINEELREEYRRYARAAIEAMREPSSSMLKAAFVAMNETPGGEWRRMKAENLSPREIFDAKMVPRWQAAIDAAL